MSEQERSNSEAETELRQLDNLLARRPALPGKSRLDDVAFMLAVLREADPSGEVARRVLARQGVLLSALAPASSERAAGVLGLLPQWEAWRAKWWTRADEERSQYALGVTAALGDCLDDLRRVLDIPEDEPVGTAVKDGEG